MDHPVLIEALDDLRQHRSKSIKSENENAEMIRMTREKIAQSRIVMAEVDRLPGTPQRLG
jgi:hypothetical protein